MSAKGSAYNECIAGLELLDPRFDQAQVQTKASSPKGEVKVDLEEAFDYTLTEGV